MITLITQLLTQFLAIMLFQPDRPLANVFGPISAGIFSVLPILLLVLIIFMFIGFILLSRKASLNTHSELMRRQLEMIDRSFDHMEKLERKLDRLIELAEKQSKIVE